MVKLVEHLRQQQFTLFDAQLMNPHLERFGAYVITSEEYDTMLTEALEADCQFVSD